MIHAYHWIYNTYNDNLYVLIIIIIMLIFIILFFDFWKNKYDLTYKNDSTGIPQTNTHPTINKVKDLFNDVTNNTTGSINAPYNIPTFPQPINNNLFITDEEKEYYNYSRNILDNNEEALINTNGSPKFILPQSNIKQINSTLYGDNIKTDENNTNVTSENYDTVGNYATLDSLGRGLTDTLGGIHTEMGYTVLEEQLGTFKKEPIINPHTYDNTSNYNTGMNPKTVDGVTTFGGNGKFSQDNKPVFLQKDFDGVANIFAPNIIVQNPPLTSDGYPDITFDM